MGAVCSCLIRVEVSWRRVRTDSLARNWHAQLVGQLNAIQRRKWTDSLGTAVADSAASTNVELQHHVSAEKKCIVHESFQITNGNLHSTGQH